VLYAASLWLSNSAYLYLSVSFIQMTKSLMPGLVYASGVALGTEQHSVGAYWLLPGRRAADCIAPHSKCSCTAQGWGAGRVDSMPSVCPSWAHSSLPAAAGGCQPTSTFTHLPACLLACIHLTLPPPPCLLPALPPCSGPPRPTCC
jgi:hypothetical protein